jgi:hypothetical protein
MHSVSLARAGWRVIAIDSSPILLAELEAVAEGLPATTRCENLLAFDEVLAPGEYADLVLCMGDTWSNKVSSCRKLRLAPEVVRKIFLAAGLRAVIEQGPRGMVQAIPDA